jgi:hypothetical protein
MGWTERHDGAPALGELAAQGIIRARIERRFIVTTDLEPSQVISGPQLILGGSDGLTGLPPYGSPHPNFGGAVVQAYAAVGNPPNIEVTAYYGYGDIDPVSPEFYSQSGDWFEETDSLPIARHETSIVTSGGELPTQQQIRSWQFDSMDTLYTSRQHTISVNVGGMIGDAINAMDEQNNRIHKIGGRWYRFKAAGYNEVRLGVWVCNYQWFYDGGTLYDESLADFYQPSSDLAIPFFVIGGAAPSPEHPGAVTMLGRSGVKYLRLPYHKRLIVPNPDGNPDSYPKFPHFLPYVVDENGWQNLIGL